MRYRVAVTTGASHWFTVEAPTPEAAEAAARADYDGHDVPEGTTVLHHRGEGDEHEPTVHEAELIEPELPTCCGREEGCAYCDPRCP